MFRRIADAVMFVRIVTAYAAIDLRRLRRKEGTSGGCWYY